MRCKCVQNNKPQAANDPHAELRRQALVVVPKLVVKDPQVGRSHLLFQDEKNLGLVKVCEEFFQGEVRCVRVSCLGREMRGAIKVFASVAGTWRDVSDSPVCDSCALHSGAVYTFR